MAKNFFSFLYKTTVDLIIYTVIALSVLALLPDSLFANFPFKPIKYEVDFADNHGSKWNNLLVEKGELLLKGQIVGPESMAIVNDSIYTGLADGRVVEINKKTLKVKDVVKFPTKPVCDRTKPLECARVLGIKFGKDGHLYAIEYYSGLVRINVKTLQKEMISIGDSPLGYDDIEFDPTLNMIYVSVLTTKWPLDQCLYGLLEPDTSGYLLAYNLDTKKSHKLKTTMPFPNGVQLSQDKKHLFVAETMNYRVLKIAIDSIHKAIKENRELTDKEIEVFVKLPGEPDNVRLDPNGDLLIALFSTRKDGKVLHEYLANWPVVRKAFARALYGLSVAIDYLNSKLINSHSLQELSSDLYTGKVFVELMPKSGSVVRVDGKTGQIKKIYGSEEFNGVTEAEIDIEGDLYFGSFISPFLGRIKKKDL